MGTNEEYPSNSKANRVAPLRPESKGEVIPVRTKPRKVISGVARREKKSLAKTLARSFAGDQTRNIGSYLAQDVLIPAAKSLIEDLFKNGIEMLLYGGESRPRLSSRRETGSKVNYGGFSSNRREAISRPSRGGNFDLEDIYFTRGSEASDVLYAMCDQLETYEAVSVADFFEFAGIPGATWAHTKWGWKDLSRAYCTHTRKGHVIVLPDPEEID